MEKRVLLAVFLSFLVLYGYQSFLVPPPPPLEPPPMGEETQEGEVSSPPTARSLPQTAARAGQSPRSQEGRITPVNPAVPEPVISDGEPRDITVESDFFRAVFSNRGGELVSWQLKEYLTGGQPVELVSGDLPAEEVWPFTVKFDDETLTDLADQALYRSSSPGLRLSGQTEALTFEYQDAGGFTIRKTYAFDPTVSPYVVRLTVDAKLGQANLQPTIQWGPALGGAEAPASQFVYQQPNGGVMYGRISEAGVFSEPSIERFDRADVVERPLREGLLDFVGVDNHYFIAAALPQQRQVAVTYRPVQLLPDLPDGEVRDLMAFDLQVPDGVNDLTFFIGPKDFDLLEQASGPLVRSIDFGFLSVLVVPLHRSLKWVYGWVGNYGFSIILLTILVNIIIFPLRHKSVVSMRKMAELGPDMKAIQNRYGSLKATDPKKQQMQKEIMELYSKNGVNPVAGCLPMILTMPILFAFYRLLSMAIEIRGAPFTLWITDLSVHDPLYVTPVIMGASMLFQQRLTPMNTADPMQQKIMMFMPVMFTFFFLWAPSGLVIYWLTSNLFGIGQQIVTNRIIGQPTTRTVRPPAEGPAKNKNKKGSAKKADSPIEPK